MNSCPYRKIIEEKGFYVCTPIGKSMEPLLIEREDTVKIVHIDRPLKKGDVILYQRPNGKYVLHRIIRIKNDEYVLCGDNQTGLEKNVKFAWIIGVMDGFYKQEKYIPITDLDYIKYYKKRMRTRVYRKIKRKLLNLLGK